MPLQPRRDSNPKATNQTGRNMRRCAASIRRQRSSHAQPRSNQQYLRQEIPPDDVIVVIRGGPIVAERIVEHAAREARDRSYKGAPMHSVSVSLTVGGRSLEDLTRFASA